MSDHTSQERFPIVNPDAAGIDIGSRFHQVSVGESAEHQAKFGVFTEDLHCLARFLQSYGI